MTIITDNVRLGAVKGLATSATGSAQGLPHTMVTATPDEIVTGQVGSDLAYDVKTGLLYMCEARGGSEWIRLGSIAL